MQDYLPDMAYQGVITAHTRHGVRLYLAHLAYINALQGSTGTQPNIEAAPATAGAAAGAAAGTAGTAVSRRA
jgi:hypothetical protein